MKSADGWRPTYEFDLQPQLAVDYEAMNHYVETWPDSHFRQVLMAGIVHARGRSSLGGNEFSRYEDGKLTERRRIRSADALEALLANEFRVSLPDHPGLAPLLERVAAAEPE